MVVFKNPRDASHMSHLARQMYPGRVKFVQDALKEVTSVTYGYLLVNLKQNTSEDRWRSGEVSYYTCRSVMVKAGVSYRLS